jgi:hypothetical protein
LKLQDNFFSVEDGKEHSSSGSSRVVQQQDGASKRQHETVADCTARSLRRSAKMCDQKEFRCVCMQEFEDGATAIQHVEQLHAGEFDARNLDEVEDAIEARITPSPLS